MSLNQGSININQKRRPPGAPFTSGSANNGLSVDPVTGVIQLGNVLGTGAGGSAELLIDREISLNGVTVNFIQFAAFPGQDVYTVMGQGGMGVGMQPNQHSANLQVDPLGAVLHIFNDLAVPGARFPEIQLSTTNAVDQVKATTAAGGVFILNNVALAQDFLTADVTGIQTATGAPLTTAPVPVRFGGTVAAAAVLDPTQYVEFVHNGVLLKLALIV